MPYVWDGHDNATRVHETGHGIKMHRNRWSFEELRGNLQTILSDEAMHGRLAMTSQQMHRQVGPAKAAQLLDGLLHRNSATAGS
jgi:UDP:flavonoid glycosyltransferase YjiC (YdhE family)